MFRRNGRTMTEMIVYYQCHIYIEDIDEYWETLRLFCYEYLKGWEIDYNIKHEIHLNKDNTEWY